MNVGRKLIKGSLLRNLEFFIMVAVTFVMTPFIVKTLGDRMYGFWSLVATFIGYYGLLDFGLTSAISRFISRAIGRDDLDDIRKVASTSLVLMIGIGFLALFITLVVVLLSPYFIEDPEEIALFRMIIVLMGVSVAAGFPVRVFGGILSSHLRYDYITLVSIFRVIITNALIFYYLEQGSGLLALTFINIVGNLLQYSALAIYCRLTYPSILISRKYFDRSKIKTLFDYSSKTFVAQLADLLRFRVDSLVIAGFLNLSLVTYYSIGARLMDYFVQFIVSTVGVLGPLYSQREGCGDMASVRDIFEKATKVCIVLAVFVGTSIMFYGKPFIERWMGPGFESSYTVTLILAVGYSIALMQSTSVNLLYGISKHNYFAVANMAEGLSNLFLSIILVKYYGIYGVALGTTITMVFFKLLLQPIYTCRSIEYPLIKYYINLLVGTMAKTLLPLGCFYLMVQDKLFPTYFDIFLYALIQGLLFAPIVYFFVFNKNDRFILRAVIFGK